MKIESRF